LIRFDVAVDGLVAAAKRRGVPFNVLHIDDAEAAPLYAKKLVLVRPTATSLGAPPGGSTDTTILMLPRALSAGRLHREL